MAQTKDDLENELDLFFNDDRQSKATSKAFNDVKIGEKMNTRAQSRKPMVFTGKGSVAGNSEGEEDSDQIVDNYEGVRGLKDKSIHSDN